MALRKSEKADLQGQYPIYIQIGLIFTLLILIGAFRANFEVRKPMDIRMEEQEVVDIEEIQQTQPPEEPPPPPRPPTPVEVPDHTELEDQDLDFDAGLDFDVELESTPPPPPEEEEEDTSDEIFVVVEDDPVLIGGLQGLHEKIRYPDYARRAGIEGRVFVQFVVNEEGDVTDAEVTRSPHRLLSEEALRVIRDAKFEPGRQRGRNVRVRMSLPITFSLR